MKTHCAVVAVLALAALAAVAEAGIREDGEAFLAAKAKEPGVVATASGLLYKYIKHGTGTRHPTRADSVECDYRGTLIDGTEFDSSYSRGRTATFPVSGVIAGWTEMLQLLVEGDNVELYIKPELGYGNRGAGGLIKGGATLVFSLELHKIK